MAFMDQTAQLLIPDFNEKFRGYDIDEVDAFLLQVSAQLAELAREKEEAVARATAAERELSQALEAAATASATPEAPTAQSALEATTGEATRMLALASQTAERAVSEARAEASRILSDANGAAEHTQREARVDADRVVAEARVAAEEMTHRATEQAAQEYGARRDEILTEIAHLESQKSTSVTQLAAVESRIEEYRAALSSIASHITELLGDQDKMLRPPIPGVELPSPAQFIDVASRPAEPFAAGAQSPTSVIESVAAEVAPGRPAFVDEPSAAFEAMHEAVGPMASSGASAPAYVDSADEDATVDPASFVVDPLDHGFHEQRGGSGEVAGTTDAVGQDDAAPIADPYEVVAGGDTSVADVEASYSGFGDPEPLAAFDEGSGAEASGQGSWAPGSWSEVAGFTATDEAFSAPPQADYGADAFGDPEPDVVNRSTFPSGGLPSIGADRYTRELDEALNAEEDDEAMARFFEADEDRQTRRFGRRR